MKTALGTIAHLCEPIISEIKNEEPVSVVENFILNVYPNPFNSTTTISFDLKKDSNLSIKVFNLAGKKIADLGQNDYFTKGTKHFRWNANNVASGIYILNINGDFLNINHKLVLIK